MRPISLQDLSADQPLPHALYTTGGRLLAHGGAVLGQNMLEFLGREPRVELGYDTRAEPSGAGSDTPPSQADDESGPRRLMDRERYRWERQLVRTKAELRRTAAATVQVARVRWERMPLGVEVGVDPIRVERGPLVSAEIPTGDDAGLRELRACGVETLKDLFETLLDRRSADAGPIVGLADGLIGALLRRPGLFAIPALGLPRPCDSLPDHCFSTGAIALGIAAQLGWPRADVRHAALSGFLADAGMALVAHPVRQAARPLTEIEVNAVRRHPEFTVGLLRNIRGLPEPVVLAAYQHQERADGSGYPLGLGSERLHDLAKVVGVAETFAGMTAPRAHRPALTPHAAMSELAHRAGARAFDRHVVRALVDLLGLYPARSFVRLSTGHVALVGAAAAPGTADRPVIHVVQPLGAGPRFGRPIDLARLEPKTLRIVEAIRTPEGIEV